MGAGGTRESSQSRLWQEGRGQEPAGVVWGVAAWEAPWRRGLWPWALGPVLPPPRSVSRRQPRRFFVKEQRGLSSGFWRRTLSCYFLPFPKVPRGPLLLGVCLPEQRHSADQGAPPRGGGGGDRLVPKKVPSGLYSLRSAVGVVFASAPGGPGDGSQQGQIFPDSKELDIKTSHLKLPK